MIPIFIDGPHSREKRMCSALRSREKTCWVAYYEIRPPCRHQINSGVSCFVSSSGKLVLDVTQ